MRSVISIIAGVWHCQHSTLFKLLAYTIITLESKYWLQCSVKRCMMSLGGMLPNHFHDSDAFRTPLPPVWPRNFLCCFSGFLSSSLCSRLFPSTSEAKKTLPFICRFSLLQKYRGISSCSLLWRIMFSV